MKDEIYCSQARGDHFLAYLYDELDIEERARVEDHLAGCRACREELSAFRSLRRELGRWTLPEPSSGFTPGLAPAPGRASWGGRIGALPGWAQAAAAALVVGMAAGLANLDVRVGEDGLHVRTGWSRQPAAAAAVSIAPWEADLQGLANQLRTELEATRAELQPLASSAVDAAHVASLIEDSERRQQRELALRIAELARDIQVQRRGDLEKIQHSLGIMESNLGAMQNIGVEVMRQRQIINELAVPASQRR